MGQSEDSLSVEDDELDRHDCMLPLVHLVEKAAALFQASHSSSAVQMPEWMKRMHTAVESSQAARVVRLFLVKVVLHVERRHAEREAAAQQQAASPALSQVQTHFKHVCLYLLQSYLGIKCMELHCSMRL